MVLTKAIPRAARTRAISASSSTAASDRAQQAGWLLLFLLNKVKHAHLLLQKIDGLRSGNQVN